ncbi:DNAJ heat shock N-terminal domain-containing family protein [Hibiscus syriacus]|uniref:DNAJ heat shock N-terminal domain-containing family protein n=2 Tax=Hibiscus syriacus TaxID=106335 RepID=A0A6A2Z633_HIBSY|nr:DNAJ heat shock N-terminal domain-containing family protein [Hibiscus syriacus]
MHNMKKIVLLLFLVSALLFSISMAGRYSKFENRLTEEEVDAALEESGEGEGIHERVLRVNTKDYGKYDPSPALVKPPFKLIPN